jgi:hypothetical protein
MELFLDKTARTHVEGVDTGQDAVEVGAELRVRDYEEPDASVAVAEAVGRSE